MDRKKMEQATRQCATIVLVATALATGLWAIIRMGYRFTHIHW